MRVERHGRDEGFSLSELIIVLALLGVVLAAIYMAATAMIRGGQVNQTQAVFARETGEGLRIIEKYLMQAIKIESAGQYTTTFLTDHNLNGLCERIRVTTTSDGNLRVEVWRCNAVQVNDSLASNTVFSTHAANVAQGVPLLTYYDVNGSVIANMGDVPANARSVRVTLVLSYNDATHQANKTVFLRNMGQ